MEQLSIKELAPYLPYRLFVYGYPYKGLDKDEQFRFQPVRAELKGLFRDGNNVEATVQFFDLKGYKWDGVTKLTMADFKPALYPLSMLTKEITVDGETFVPAENMYNVNRVMHNESFDNCFAVCNNVISGKCFLGDLLILPHLFIQKLFEWHFDVFGLIEKGLAIDKTTLPQ